ncbi:MAG: hypothetical protein WC378_00290 [Opitutaceae bacterium]|jgi:hypothetical protein
MKVWITQHALTDGIKEVEGEIANTCDSMLVVMGERGFHYYVHKPFWHTTLKSARKHAMLLKERKLASLRKQIARVEKLEF